jgi:hypothetical protein
VAIPTFMASQVVPQTKHSTTNMARWGASAAPGAVPVRAGWGPAGAAIFRMVTVDRLVRLVLAAATAGTKAA